MEPRLEGSISNTADRESITEPIKKQPLSISRIRNKLPELSKRFVFVPSDKAANNVVVVCRKYYTDVLKNDILYSCTFKFIRSTESHIVKKHITITSMLKVSSEHLKVRTMYWVPRLHKNHLNIVSSRPLVSVLQVIFQCF